MLKNKKGFTIVELVVVIAVISILAAVLIPTFTNIIQRAHSSNDTVMLKNMNKAITVYGVNTSVETATDVCIVLKQNNFLGKTTPETQNKKFVWNVDTKTIEMVDDDEQDGSWILIDFPIPKEETTIDEIDFVDLK